MMNSTQLRDERRPFINDEAFSVLMLINPAIITCGISIFGIGANIANIATFIKLGFKETINISLVTLTVTDLANLVCLLWMSLCYNPSFCLLVCDVIDVKRLEDVLGGDQRAYCASVSGGITGLIACERCMCVLRPLRVKALFTKKRILIILSFIFIVSALPYFPILYTSVLTFVFNPETNRSILTVKHKDSLYTIDPVCYSLIMAVTLCTYVIITVFTALIVRKLASQSQWRAGQATESFQPQVASTPAAGDVSNKRQGLSGRDRRATVTVTVIAVMYIGCFFPGSVLYLAMSVSAEFNKGMLYTNLYDFLWYLAFVGESICSSANIIVYLKTSTKFKEAFLSLFCRPFSKLTDQERK